MIGRRNMAKKAPPLFIDFRGSERRKNKSSLLNFRNEKRLTFLYITDSIYNTLKMKEWYYILYN